MKSQIVIYFYRYNRDIGHKRVFKDGMKEDTKNRIGINQTMAIKNLCFNSLIGKRFRK